MQFTRVENVEVYPVGTDEEKEAFYKFFNRNSKLYVKAMNKVYSHHYIESILQSDIAYLDSEYNDRVKKIEMKIEELRSTEASQDKVEKEYKKLNKLRNNKIAESRKILDEAIGLLTSTRTRDLGKNFDFDFSDFIDSANQKATKDFKNDYVELITGKRSARTYRMNYKKGSLPYRGRDVKIYENNGKYYVNLPLGFHLAVYLGRKPSKAQRVKNTLTRILEGNVKLGQSILKNENGKFFLKLTIQFEKDDKNVELIKNKVLIINYTDQAQGVALIKDKEILEFGDANRIRDFKQRIKVLRSKEQSRSLFAKGGHGRKRKLSHDKLEANKLRESNFVKTYNNQISRQIVTCALHNKCDTVLINYQLVKSINQDWAYYQLHDMIDKKASEYGIEVVVQ